MGPDITAITLIFAGAIALDLAALRWGYDSRDRRDQRDRPTAGWWHLRR